MSKERVYLQSEGTELSGEGKKFVNLLEMLSNCVLGFYVISLRVLQRVNQTSSKVPKRAI